MYKTACDVEKAATELWRRSDIDSMTRNEVADLADELYYMITEMHKMAERMENRLGAYRIFSDDLFSNLKEVLRIDNE